MAQWVKHLLYKPDELSLIPRIHVKMTMLKRKGQGTVSCQGVSISLKKSDPLLYGQFQAAKRHRRKGRVAGSIWSLVLNLV